MILCCGTALRPYIVLYGVECFNTEALGLQMMPKVLGYLIHILIPAHELRALRLVDINFSKFLFVER
jgi:hypothetical protein